MGKVVLYMIAFSVWLIIFNKNNNKKHKYSLWTTVNYKVNCEDSIKKWSSDREEEKHYCITTTTGTLSWIVKNYQYLGKGDTVILPDGVTLIKE